LSGKVIASKKFIFYLTETHLFQINIADMQTIPDDTKDRRGTGKFNQNPVVELLQLYRFKM